MKLENQVVSLDLAKRLKELGVRQESLCVWTNAGGGYKVVSGPGAIVYNPAYSAFTVAELGEMLPNHYSNGNMRFHLRMPEKTDNGGWIYAIPYVGDDEDLSPTEADTEADARAKCLIYLLENNLIKVDEIRI